MNRLDEWIILDRTFYICSHLELEHIYIYVYWYSKTCLQLIFPEVLSVINISTTAQRPWYMIQINAIQSSLKYIWLFFQTLRYILGNYALLNSHTNYKDEIMWYMVWWGCVIYGLMRLHDKWFDEVVWYMVWRGCVIYGLTRLCDIWFDEVVW